MSRRLTYRSLNRNTSPMYRELNDALRGPRGRCKHDDSVPIYADAPFVQVQKIVTRADKYHNNMAQMLVEGECFVRNDRAKVWVPLSEVPFLKTDAIIQICDVLNRQKKTTLYNHNLLCNHRGALAITDNIWNPRATKPGEGGVIEQRFDKLYVVHCKRCLAKDEVRLFPSDFTTYLELYRDAFLRGTVDYGPSNVV